MDSARTIKQYKYMFDAETGELSIADDEIFSDYENHWFYISEEDYPVYENDVYIGCYWCGEFRTFREIIQGVD